MKIVITDWKTVTDGDLSLDSLQAIGEVTAYPLTKPEEIVERIRDADVVLCNKTPLTAEVLKDAPHLKYIGLFATGYNNIDVKGAKELGIAVTNIPAYSTDAVHLHPAEC